MQNSFPMRPRLDLHWSAFCKPKLPSSLVSYKYIPSKVTTGGSQTLFLLLEPRPVLHQSRSSQTTVHIDKYPHFRGLLSVTIVAITFFSSSIWQKLRHIDLASSMILNLQQMLLHYPRNKEGFVPHNERWNRERWSRFCFESNAQRLSLLDDIEFWIWDLVAMEVQKRRASWFSPPTYREQTFLYKEIDVPIMFLLDLCLLALISLCVK